MFTLFYLSLDATIAESDSAIGEFLPPRIMADDYDNYSLPVYLVSENLTNVSSRLGIQRGCRFICEKNRRTYCESPRNGDALFLSGTELVRFLVEFGTQAELKEQVSRHFHLPRASRVANFEAKRNIVNGRQGMEKAKSLEDEADPALPNLRPLGFAQPVNGDTVYEHGALVWR